MQALEIRDFEIERRLDAFARARLSPDPHAIARARARVMREARLQFGGVRAMGQGAPAVTLPARGSTARGWTARGSRARRLALPLLAASLWLGVAVGSVAASGAGGPLYPARLWLEAATLPANAADRAAAEVTRLEARLGDAMTAAARGDTGGVEAALEAYREITDETIAVSTGDQDLEAIVGTALDRHRIVLTAVAARLEKKGDTTAAASVETAIEHNADVVAGFTKSGGSGDRGTGGPGAGNGAGDEGTGDRSGDHGGGAGGSSGGGSGNGSGSGAGPGGATGGENDGAGSGGATGGGNGGANPGNGGNGKGGGGEDGGGKPGKEPKPTPTDGGPTDGGEDDGN